MINIVLLARDLFQGSINLGPAVAAVISTVFYSTAAIAIAARIFGTDAVLYGSTSTWGEWLKRPDEFRSRSTLSGALLFLAVLFPLYIFLANLHAQLAGADIQLVLTAGAVITAFLFGALPLTSAWYSRIRIPDAFALRPAPFLALLTAALLGFCLWPLAHEVVVLHRLGGITSLNQESLDRINQLVESWQSLSPVFIVATMAIVPAIFEEMFFRGFLLSALLGQMSARRAIVISSCLFGLFHVVAATIAVERFLPSTLIGLVLGWICWKTRSLLPGILLHACHNGLLVTIAYYQDWFTQRGWGVEDTEHLPGQWLLMSVIGTLIGILVLKYVANTQPTWDPVLRIR